MKILLCLSTLCMCFQPAFAFDAEGTKSETPIVDIALDRSGQLDLRTLNAAGQPLANQVVWIEYGQQQVCQLRTTNKGFGRVQKLRPGIHTVRSGNHVIACRFWNANTAPPNAVKRLALVVPSDNGLTRSQYGPGPVMIGPVFAATALTAAAVATVLIAKGGSSDSSPAVIPASP